MDRAGLFKDHDVYGLGEAHRTCALCAARADNDGRNSADMADVFRRLKDLKAILLRGLDYEPIEVLDDVTRLLHKAQGVLQGLGRTASSETASQRSTPDLLCSERCSSTSSNDSRQTPGASKGSKIASGSSSASHKEIAVQVCPIMN